MVSTSRSGGGVGGSGSDMSKVITVNKMIEDLRSRLPVMKSSVELINNHATNANGAQQ